MLNLGRIYNRRRDYRGRRLNAAAIALLCSVSLFCFGCGPHKQIDWAAAYSDARQKADRHDSVAAFELADRGFREVAQENPTLNYQFRILKAETIAYDKPAEALQLLDSAPPSSLASGEFAVRRKIIQGLASGYQQNFSAAEKYFEEAKRLAANSKPELLPNVAYAQGSLARVSGKGTPETYYREAIKLAQQYKAGLVETDALAILGGMEMDRERYDAAILLLQRALDGARQLHAEFTEQLTLGNLGWSYYQLGEFDRSISLLTQAEKAAAAIQWPKYQELWSTDLGDVFLDLNDYARAESSYSRAHSIAVSLKDNRGATGALHNLVQLELKRNNLKKAEEYNQSALTADQSVSDAALQSFCMLSTAEIAARRKQFSTAEPLFRAIIKNSKDSSLSWRAQSDLADLYTKEGKSQEADQEFQAAIHTVEEARGKVQQEEHRMSILDAWPFYDEYIRFLVHQKNERKALQIAEFSRSRTLAEGLGIVGPRKSSEISTTDVQSFLKAQKKIILAYWLANEESYLWLVSPSQFKVFRLQPKQRIEDEIEAYTTKLLQHHGLDDSSNGQKLYELLIDPAKKFIPKDSSIIVIPNRSLYKLNFETLVVPGRQPHYFIEDATIEVAGSFALLAASTHRRSKPSKQLLLIGAPVQADKEFPLLSHAGEEIQKVEAHFDSAQEKVISGKDATPSAYGSAQAALFQFIHFVTHGTASNTSPLDSAIILSPQADHSFKLYARNIVSTQLNAEVVIISACYGAGTKTYSGEGLVGLAWAFLRAGAHRVIAGLWEVDDRATPDLMDSFYTTLKHFRPSKALRQAKLKMVRSTGVYRFPYYWASLQLYMGS